MKKRIAVVGASGRTGRFVVEALREDVHLTLGAALVSAGSCLLGTPVPGFECAFSCALEAIDGCDGVIDFSTPDVSILVAQRCAERKIPLLVATTGHSEGDAAKLRELGTRIPCFIAPNTSVGAATLSLVAEYAKKLLGASFDVEVLEIHHKHKKDAPSGTARTLVGAVVEGGNPVVFGREGLRKDGEVGVVSLRGGDVAGDHTVYFLGHGERIELTHRATDPRIFGAGAVHLMTRLMIREPGLYFVRDLLTANLM